MAAIHARGKNGDNSIMVGKGLKMQNSQKELNCSKKKYTIRLFDGEGRIVIICCYRRRRQESQKNDF